MANNFNTSSTGIDITATVEKDILMGQIYFQQSIVLVDGKYIYTSCGNLSDNAIEFVPLPRQKGKLLKAMTKDEISFLDYYTKTEMCNMKQDDLIDVLEEVLWDDDEVQEFYEENDIQTTKETDYCKIEVRGYNQGDYAEVWVNVKEYEAEFGSTFVEADTAQYIKNLFYDSPQYVKIEINTVEFIDENAHQSYWNYGDDDYNYDKDRFIAWLLEATKDDGFDKATLAQELEGVLPDECEYKGY